MGEITSEVDRARERHYAQNFRLRGFETPPQFWYDLDPSRQKGQDSRHLADAMAHVRRLWEEGAARDLWCVTLTGPTGVGKTHILQGAVMASERWAYYVTMQRFDQRVKHFDMPPEGPEPREYIFPETPAKAWAYQLAREAPFLALDDIGMGYVDKEWTRAKLEEVIDFRWSNRLPLIVSTNLSAEKLKAEVGPRSFSRLNSSDALMLPVTGKDLR
jgi:DNA replication protein DnaC